MPIINLKQRLISCKVVYFGPSLGGKTTNILSVHKTLPQQHRSALQQINTESDRTLFFDYFSLNVAQIGGLQASFQIYTVPGQIYYKSTRKMVLHGVDGVVFVADSDAERFQDNLESYQDFKDLLTENGYDHEAIPLVIQYNKRDLPNVTSLKTFEGVLNERKAASYEAVAIRGEGVVTTFRAICSQIVSNLQRTNQLLDQRNERS